MQMNRFLMQATVASCLAGGAWMLGAVVAAPEHVDVEVLADFGVPSVNAIQPFSLNDSEYKIESFRAGSNHGMWRAGLAQVSRKQDGQRFQMKLFKTPPHDKRFDRLREGIFNNMAVLNQRKLDPSSVEMLADSHLEAARPVYFDFEGAEGRIMGLIIAQNECVSEMGGSLMEVRHLQLSQRKALEPRFASVVRALTEARILHLDGHWKNWMVCQADQKYYPYLVDWKSMVVFPESSLHRDDEFPRQLSFLGEDARIRRLLMGRQGNTPERNLRTAQIMNIDLDAKISWKTMGGVDVGQHD